MTKSINSPDDNNRSSQKNTIYETESLSGPLTGTSICIIGAGFVGCVAAAGFAKFGHDVVCIEIDPDKLAQLKDGRLPFYEPDLEELIKSGLESGRLTFSDDLQSEIENRKIFFISVGTPSGEDGRTDLKALESIVDSLSGKLGGNQVLVIKSTVPIGTADFLRKKFAEKISGPKAPSIISNPEFLREGNAVYDFFNPQRIVIGGDDASAIEAVKHVYKIGMINSVPIIVTNNKTAEMIKYSSNVFLAMKVGYVNEIAKLCDSAGVDVLEVAQAMGYDRRIGGEFLNPGPGWGGSCLPKDLREFTGLGKARGITLEILQAVARSNRMHHEYVVSKIESLTGHLDNKKIAVLGLSFKAETSDLRESPSISIIRILLDYRAIIRGHDPAVMRNDPLLPDGITLFDSPYDTVKDSDCIVVLTEWPEFQLLDWQRVSELVKAKNIVDARNLLSSQKLRDLGFAYTGMGQI
jgi:UDPglucose 6-dehydrogenase